MEVVMKAYKGFNKDMTCLGVQYEIGKEYEADRVKCCESGFHVKHRWTFSTTTRPRHRGIA